MNILQLFGLTIIVLFVFFSVLVLMHTKKKTPGIQKAHKNYPLIHIFGQRAFHDDVFIVGNYEGIRDLYFALTEAMQGKEEVIPVYVNDGEGYNIYVKIDDRISLHEGHYAVPYSADYAAENREDAIFPWTQVAGADKAD